MKNGTHRLKLSCHEAGQGLGASKEQGFPSITHPGDRRAWAWEARVWAWCFLDWEAEEISKGSEETWIIIIPIVLEF
jgi:hypothetical protein